MIRKATSEDIDSIWSIYSSIVFDVNKIDNHEYSSTAQKNGFIISESTKEEVASRITSSQDFQLYEEGGEIQGFLDINKETYFPEEADNIIWFDENLKEEYFHGNNNTALHLIALNQNARNKGIASSLFNTSLNKLKDSNLKYLFSIITIGPVTNCPSLVWHEKNGFKRVCVTMPIELFGLKDYMSLLLCKTI